MKTYTKNFTIVLSKWSRFLGAMLMLALMVSAVAFSYTNPTAIPLGTKAGTFGALAYSGITTAGTFTVNGNLGTSTATISTNLTAGAGGTKYATGDQYVLDAQTELATALSNALGRTADDGALGTTLGGRTLGCGVYEGGALDLASGATLTLTGSATDIFIIKAASSLTINTDSHVVLGGTAVWSNVFWYVGTSATIFSGTTFNGIVLAEASITLNASATLVTAKLLAHGAAVTVNSTVLPVELVSFTATANRLNADLHWSTATEINNYGFEIQRRQNADWSKVGFVSGAGTTNAPRVYSYTDNNLTSGRYTYRLKQVDNNGAFSYHGSVEVVIAGTVTTEFALSQNYPNPFNPSTQIHYSVGKADQVSLKIYNVLGLEVATLVNGRQEAGSYTVPFNAAGTPGLSSGVYFCRLEAGSFVATNRLILMK